MSIYAFLRGCFMQCKGRKGDRLADSGAVSGLDGASPAAQQGLLPPESESQLSRRPSNAFAHSGLERREWLPSPLPT